MATKTIYRYKTSNGIHVCDVDPSNTERPVKFSKHFMSLRNAGYKKVEVPVEKKKKPEIKKKVKPEVKPEEKLEIKSE